jgi:hypothetical protein
MGPALFFVMTVDFTDADDFTASLIRFLSFKMVEMVDCENPDSREMTITGLPPSCWAIILSFISRVIAFLLFFSPEAEDADGRFVDIMGFTNTKHDIQKTRVLVITRLTGSYSWLPSVERA